MKSNKGFSLVELIVVIAIMAIIAGVAIPVYTTYIDKTNKAADEQLFADIQDVLAYALVADVEGTLGNGLAVVIGANGIDTTKTAQNAIDILTEAKLHETGLKYDGWNSTEISADIAAAIANSNYFTDGSGNASFENAEALLENVQDLANAYEVVMGKNGNQVVFDVAEEIGAVENMQDILDVWTAQTFQETNAVEIISKYADVGIDSPSTNVALHYANAKAMVSHVQNTCVIEEGNAADTFVKQFQTMTDAFAGISGDNVTSEVVDTMNGTMIGMLTTAQNARSSANTDDQNFASTVGTYLSSTNKAAREQDAKAFISTLNIATEYADDLDVNTENLFTTGEVKGYVKDQLASLNVLQSLVGITGSEGTVVIVATKGADGRVTFSQYK